VSEQIRVLVVDDDALVRAGLSMLLAGVEEIVIVGEAGLGKSRLIAETRAEWDRRMPHAHIPDESHRAWETWQCVSYDATRPYSQYRRRVARVAGIEDTDDREQLEQDIATLPL